MIAITIPAGSNAMDNQLDYRSPSKEICSYSTGNSTSCFPCAPSALRPVDEINSEPTRSTLSEIGPTSSEMNPLLRMLVSHFVGAFKQLELLGPESSLSARLNDFEKLTDDQLSSGAVFLRKSHFMGTENSSSITEIQITWEKGKQDGEPEVDSSTAPDALSFYNNLDNCVNDYGSIQLFTVCYKLTLESYTGHDNEDAAHIIHHSSAVSEMATNIHGDLYHRSGETESHWAIRSSRSRSLARPPNGLPKRYTNIPVSYKYSFYREETLLCVVIQKNMRTAAMIQLGLQYIDGNTLELEDSVDRKATQFDVDAQTSIPYQKLFLKAYCRDFSKKEGTMKHESTSNQQGRSDRVKAAVNMAAQKNPETSQSQYRRKPIKRQKDFEELESDELEGKTTPGGISSKKIKVANNTGDLACPFYKMDPWKFDRCLTYKLTKMSYVKQHLLRYHDAPHCNCPVCQRPLSNKAQRDRQTDSQDCQQSQHTVYIMTAKQKREIQRATGRKITCEGKWYQVWSILFPDAKKPDSPFVKGHYFAEVLSSIRASYHGSELPAVEETFRQVMKNSQTYHEAFDELLKKIEHQVLIQSLGLGSSLHFDSIIETVGADLPVARKSPSVKSLSTNNNELLSFFPIPDDHSTIPIPSPSVIIDDKQQALGRSSEMLPCNPKPQEVPFTHNDTDVVEAHGLSLGLLDTSPFHQICRPMPHQETLSLTPEPQNTVNDNVTINMFQMGAISDFTYSSISPTAANHINIDDGIPDWVAEMQAEQHQVIL
ncbi:hypothetical protein FHL15_006971 [Xylaria flabelliformis]|uniref:Uncharacterized protein n=1 Tax=Xylaria flabelliformis TaxID=2512241 RepID=A0A553HVW9_9PEZI|nr:hypothetical protein FHL15_006971 [Xylaria flabelliformis]